MPEPIAKLIDHSLLHPTMTDEQLAAECQVARRLGVASVCIKPYAVHMAAQLLRGSGVAVGTVIGFPHGSSATDVKAFEADRACAEGATELDMVVNVGKVLSGDWDYVEADIAAVVAVARRYGAVTKVIFENDFLPDDSTKIELCRICERCGVEYVKTSTGYGFVKQPGGGYAYKGATEHDVKLMRASTGPAVQVKAAGGVRTYADAVKMRELGVTRIGASASEAIVAEETEARESSPSSASP